MKDKLKIGITGGIGAGKSSVSKFLEVLGYPVYNADERAKELVVEDSEVKAAIINLLGEQAYLEDGRYNRQWVGQQVFADDQLLKSLNHIVHPAVAKDFQKWSGRQSSRLIFKEAAIMLEHGKDLVGVDYIVAVVAPEQERIQRIRKRDTFRSEAQIHQIIRNQIPEKDLKSKADFLIDNADHSAVIPQVNSLLHSLIRIIQA
ncbi:dephospho-CoA kinase [Persicobacter sp. CCB-QB2]|uniref:dephospho-CoA kinase n=1 Tax=Persicobacter sp. CCB-QB2 TaxID=1561025 RepID=UPI0006A972F9|nr:dephospho-CoA kinase [Persicobacter sp. CCB-QB2]